MNNNRGNNRRRGRGNNRQNNGGQQVNRIDSRARGNAPQLLEKYRKLAHDAHLNGDRVQEEYYLQFADHYFRVIADTRQRQEEQRARREDRWQEGGEGYRDDAGDDAGEYGADGDYAGYEQPQSYGRRDREERPERSERPERAERQDRGERPERAERGERQNDGRRRDRNERAERPERAEREAPVEAVEPVVEAEANLFEPEQNPFVRPTRGLKPRREDRRPRRAEGGEEEGGSFDPSFLPPSISTREEPAPVEAAPQDEAPAEEKPKRTRRRKAAADDAGETLESTN